MKGEISKGHISRKTVIFSSDANTLTYSVDFGVGVIGGMVLTYEDDNGSQTIVDETSFGYKFDQRKFEILKNFIK